MMRIITGTARGTKLVTLEGTQTRPTAEVAKEAMFSAIQFELHDRRVLDLFGGSGQLALEALSRGADSAVICDSSRQATAIIKENAQKTKLIQKCVILTTDWKEYLNGIRGREQFGLVFLDPPYADGILDEVLETLVNNRVLSDDAIVICESDQDGIPTPLVGYRQKLHHFGKTYVSVYRKEQEDAQ